MWDIEQNVIFARNIEMVVIFGRNAEKDAMLGGILIYLKSEYTNIKEL